MFDDPRIQQRYASRAELRHILHQRPAADWLSDSECAALSRLRHPERREAWLAGRLLSKQLMAAENGLPASDYRSIEICSVDVRGKGTRPIVSVGGHIRDWSLSISHSETAVFVALSMMPDLRVGVDLTPIQEYRPGFLNTWFTADERQQVQAAGSRRAIEVWAVKEAVYKASNTGETFAPRRIEVRAESQDRFFCRYDGNSSRMPLTIRVKDAVRDIAAIAITQPQEKHDD